MKAIRLLARKVALATMLLLTSVQPSMALTSVNEVLARDTSECFDGIGLTFTNREFEEALALGGQDETEFKMARYACGSYEVDSRYEHAQCTEPLIFSSFSAAGEEPGDWVICLVAVLIEDGGRGMKVSLDDYEAILATGEAVKPDPVVSSWPGNHEDLFDVDISTERIFSAGSLNYGVLAFPDMPDDNFVLRDLVTGNQFLVIARENAVGDLMPFVAAPEVGDIVLTGNGFGSSQWVMSLGHRLGVTVETEIDRSSGIGGLISVDAEYRRDGGAILPERDELLSEFIDCPPCQYSRTTEFTPEAGQVFHFTVLADGPWTITVEAIE